MVGNLFFLVSEAGETIEVTHGMLVGRDSKCTMTLDDAEVSRQHAKIVVTDRGVAIEDLKSHNGTFVQGTRIEETQLLYHGDEVRFGPCVFKVAYEKVDIDNATVIMPRRETLPVQQEPEEEGDQGSIEVMPLTQNLPPVWIDDGHSGTEIYSLADVKKMASNQGEEELRELEATIDAPTLLILSGSDKGRTYKLQKSGNLSFWTIGRDPTSHDLSIVIDDSSVSNFHAKLVHKEGRWKIVDQMSTNHTYVNGDQYNSAFLSSKDSIRFGRVNTLFLLPSQEEPERQDDVLKGGFIDRLKTVFKK